LSSKPRIFVTKIFFIPDFLTAKYGIYYIEFPYICEINIGILPLWGIAALNIFYFVTETPNLAQIFHQES